MRNDSDLPDADAENEELLRELELAAQKLQSASQQVAELSQKLAETAMARVVGHRRIDLRALRSLDLRPGEYQISTSEPEEPNPRVTLTWLPGTLILGPDLIPTDRDISLSLPTIREMRFWQISPPPPNAIPPRLPPPTLGPLSEAESALMRQQYQERSRAWAAHHQRQTQAAAQWVATDRHRARQDEEKVAEAMMSEIEARRLDPTANAGRTIMDVGQELARQLLLTSRNEQV